MKNSPDGFTNLEFWIYEFFNKHLLWFLFQIANWETFAEKISETKERKTSNEFVNSQENISMSKIGNCSRAGLNDVSRVIILDLYGMVFDAVVKNTFELFSWSSEKLDYKPRSYLESDVWYTFMLLT